ncbi:MAG: hypothetical protein FVQ79_08255 [Planctomycetes bacterium]|nr:hypothetical protein [Planctomycetota bacterium]
MNDLFEYILAAGRKKPNDFSWVVPIVLVVFYGLAGLARAFKKSDQEQSKPEKGQPAKEDRQTSQRWQEQALRKQQHREDKLQRQETRHQQRYTKQHHIVTGDVELHEEHIFEPEMPAEGGRVKDEKQNILREMMGQVYRQATGEIPQPARKTVSRKPVRKEPVMKSPLKRKPARIEEKPKERIVQTQTHGLAHLAGLDELKKAIVYAEILGKPIALRDN